MSGSTDSAFTGGSEPDPGLQLLEQGRTHYGQGEYNEALSCLHMAYDAYRADGHTGHVAEVANDIGVVYTVLERWQEAQQWLSESQRLFVSEGDYGGEAQTLRNIGSMYRVQGDLGQAAAHLQLSADRFHLVGDEDRRSATLSALSAVRLRQLRALQALAAYQGALDCHPNPGPLRRSLRVLLDLPFRLLQG
jgi:tetratricopeptide (TPR) repeat protein